MVGVYLQVSDVQREQANGYGHHYVVFSRQHTHYMFRVQNKGNAKKKQLGGLCIICCWRLDDVIILHQGGWESMAEAGLDG